MIWFKMPQIFFCRIDISATVTSQDSLGQTIPGTKTWGKGYSKWSDFLSKPEVFTRYDSKMIGWPQTFYRTPLKRTVKIDQNTSVWYN